MATSSILSIILRPVCSVCSPSILSLALCEKVSTYYSEPTLASFPGILDVESTLSSRNSQLEMADWFGVRSLDGCSSTASRGASASVSWLNGLELYSLRADPDDSRPPDVPRTDNCAEKRHDKPSFFIGAFPVQNHPVLYIYWLERAMDIVTRLIFSAPRRSLFSQHHQHLQLLSSTIASWRLSHSSSQSHRAWTPHIFTLEDDQRLWDSRGWLQ